MSVRFVGIVVQPLLRGNGLTNKKCRLPPGVYAAPASTERVPLLFWCCVARLQL